MAETPPHGSSHEARQDALYQREYPRLFRQLEWLSRLALEQDPNVALIVLFGSTARLEPHHDSDADVLILTADPALFAAGQPYPGIDIVWKAYQADLAGAWDDLGRWPATAVVSDERASDLGEDLLSNIARDGVEIYRRAGYVPPALLADLQPYAAWRATVARVVDLPGA